MNSTLEELYLRRQVCRVCIQAVSEITSSDPRQADALVEYNRQLAEIDAKIAALVGAPPAIVIGLKSASLAAKPSELG